MEPAALDVNAWQARLGLSDARVLAGGALSVVLSCRRGAEQVVLKLSGSDLRPEAAALAAWDGGGACRLLWADQEGRALLLGFVAPGTALEPRDDAADAARAASLLRRLHGVPIPAVVPDAAVELDWRFRRAHEKLDTQGLAADLITHAQLDAAHEQALALHAARRATVLLHGDFLGKNLLPDRRGEWVAIDPRPCRGDPHLDAAFWALCHRHGPGVRERCTVLRDSAGFDAGLLLAWTQAFAASETALVRDRARALSYASVLGGSTSSASS